MVTVKYVFIVLNADNKGEGGTFALYSLISHYVCCGLLIDSELLCSLKIGQSSSSRSSLPIWFAWKDMLQKI